MVSPSPLLKADEKAIEDVLFQSKKATGPSKPPAVAIPTRVIMETGRCWVGMSSQEKRPAVKPQGNVGGLMAVVLIRKLIRGGVA
jgi:hypothetical protein